MKISFVTAFLVLVSGMANASSSLSLPPKAKIQINSQISTGNSPNDTDCKGFKLNRAQVRHIFETYKPVTVSDLHDYYTWTNCSLDGTLTVYKKFFTWKIRPGHILETDYPDGAMKTLGGAHTDSPDGK